jgi:hypothetical protein
MRPLGIAQDEDVAFVARQVLQHAGNRHHEPIAIAAKRNDQGLRPARNSRIAVKTNIGGEVLAREALRRSVAELPEDRDPSEPGLDGPRQQRCKLDETSELARQQGIFGLQLKPPKIALPAAFAQRGQQLINRRTGPRRP